MPLPQTFSWINRTILSKIEECWHNCGFISCKRVKNAANFLLAVKWSKCCIFKSLCSPLRGFKVSEAKCFQFKVKMLTKACQVHLNFQKKTYNRSDQTKQDQRSTASTRYQLGPLSHLGHFGSHLGPSGNYLGPFGNHLGPFGRHLVPFGSHTSWFR